MTEIFCDQIKKYFKFVINSNELGLNEIKIIDVKFLARGASNLNYIVNVDNKKFVFRMNILQQSSFKNQLKREFDILKYLENENISPKAFILDESNSFFKHDLIIIEYIEGSKIKPNFDSLSRTAKTLRKLHKMPIKQELNLKKGGYQNDLKEIEEVIVQYQNKNNFNLEFLEKIKRFYEKIKQQVNNLNIESFCIIHRDLVGSNGIDDENVVKLIDWEVQKIDECFMDFGVFLSPANTLWDFGRILSEKEEMHFLKSYFERNPNSEELKKTKLRKILASIFLAIWIENKLLDIQNDEMPKEMYDEDVINRWTRSKDGVMEYLKEKLN